MVLTPEERREHKRESQRRWSQAHPDYGRQWKAAHPEARRRQYEAYKPRRAEHRAEHGEEIRQKARERERRRRERAKSEESRKQRDRDRARAWAQAHPEQARARQAAWAQANREKRREQALAYYYRHHEERTHALREQNTKRRASPSARRDESRYRDEKHERYKGYAAADRADPAKRSRQREYRNEWRRRERRRLRLGLPRVAGHRATTNERLDNEKAATEFLTRPRSTSERHALHGEHAETIILTVLARILDRSLDAPVSRLLRAIQQSTRLTAAVDAYLVSPPGRRLRREVRMDVIARLYRGAPAYPSLDRELRRRALAVMAEVTSTPAPLAPAHSAHQTLELAI